MAEHINIKAFHWSIWQTVQPKCAGRVQSGWCIVYLTLLRQSLLLSQIVLMLSGLEQRHKVYFTGSCRYHPSDKTEASIKSTSHAHLRQCTQLFWNHIHMWNSRRCRWEWSYNSLSMTDVNLLPDVEGATGPGWQLVVNTGIVSQTLSLDQTQWRWMGSTFLPWHRILQPTKGPHLTSVLRALKKHWPEGHKEPNYHFTLKIC